MRFINVLLTYLLTVVYLTTIVKFISSITFFELNNSQIHKRCSEVITVLMSINIITISTKNS